MRILKPQAFTLIELLVAIAVVGIISLGVANMNFNTISDRQTLDRGANKIISIIEEQRNNALLGKGFLVLGEIYVPKKLLLYIHQQISTPGLEVATGYRDHLNSPTMQDFFYSNNLNNVNISHVSCSDIDGSNLLDNLNHIITLEFIGRDISYSDLTCGERKIINIHTEYKGYSKVISINTLNGLIAVTN